MHKIKKGIKKKIKGKKGKDKEDDLFDPELLAKYKKEIADAAQTEHKDSDPEEDSSSLPVRKGADEDEEWQKFKLLTSGIDQVLKKTSGDLDRIKSSSYFQKSQPKATFQLPNSSQFFASTNVNVNPADRLKSPFPSVDNTKNSKEEAHWVDVEKTSTRVCQEETDQPISQDTLKNVDEECDATEPDSPEVDTLTVDDELFDTSFVDAVTTGDIKLAYIPDSPTGEVEGEDPFDTSTVAAVVSKFEEEERKKKRQVNLGLAVNVLTGKGADGDVISISDINPTRQIIVHSTRRPRPGAINLLGDPENQATQATHSSKENPLNLLDDLIAPLPLNSDIVIPTCSKSPLLQQDDNSNCEKSNLNELLDEFDTIGSCGETSESQTNSEEVNVEEGFEALAAESFHKLSSTEQSIFSAAASLAASEKTTNFEEDPFDTSFVEQFPSQGQETTYTTELVVDEEGTNVDLDNQKESLPLTSFPAGVDLLGENTPYCNSTVSEPIQPETSDLVETDIDDPFDTSVVQGLLPGSAELKLIEAELLANASLCEESDDFDPRKDEQQGTSIKSQEHIAIHPLDLIVESDSKIKPLSPQISNSKFVDKIDPFDTSRVCQAAVPGKLELKLIESELVQEDINNRPSTAILNASGAFGVKGPACCSLREDLNISPPLQLSEDIFGSEGILPNEKILTPIINQPSEEDFKDPFDTSTIVSSTIGPGKAELKFLEKELLDTIEDFQPPILPKIPQLPLQKNCEPHPLELEEDIVCNEPLQPTQSYCDSKSDKFQDPFDTSFATTITPGKTELKILEAELVHDSAFEPVSKLGFGPVPLSAIPLIPQAFSLQQSTSLNDETTDPFDTSIADGILPGKAELKILEAELL